jgi:predicted O-methyltransferase YrrM
VVNFINRHVRSLRRRLSGFKAWVRRRGDQRRIQRTALLSPEDRAGKRSREHVLVDLVHEHCPASGAVVVEVGSLYGETSAHVLKYCPQIAVLYAVDIRKPEPARNRIAGLPRARFVLGDSRDVAAGFENESIDLVFIDADHSRDAVLGDLEAWTPKVKKGGVIAGHDYGARRYPGVKEAVDAFFRGHPHGVRRDANKVWWTIR